MDGFVCGRVLGCLCVRLWVGAGVSLVMWLLGLNVRVGLCGCEWGSGVNINMSVIVGARWCVALRVCV